MAEVSNSPVPAGNARLPPSTTPSQQRRNNSNKNNRSRKSNQVDGTISDGVAIAFANSPRSNKAQHKQRSSTGRGAVSDHNSTGRINGPKQRPASANAEQVLATPAKEQAYAGPIFSASPAASSLPMPKFFSRSLPDNEVQPSLQARLASEKIPDDSSSSPESAVIAPTLPREPQQSPLDLFFQADKAEKERIRGGSGSLSPESARCPRPHATVPRDSFQQNNNGVFQQELGSRKDSLPNPEPLPPNHLPGPAEYMSLSSSRLNESDDERQAKTKSLKELLFNAVSTPPASTSHSNSGPQTPDEFFGSPSPFHHSPSGPSTPQPSVDSNANYSLHYGNRNLSPLFKAARSDTPPRPSSLRQEFAGAPSSVDSNAFSRSFMHEQTRASQPTNTPQIYFGGKNHPGARSDSVRTQAPLSGQPVSTQHGEQNTNISRPSDSDIRGMEDNLRRMLKIA